MSIDKFWMRVTYIDTTFSISCGDKLWNTALFCTIYVRVVDVIDVRKEKDKIKVNICLRCMQKKTNEAYLLQRLKRAIAEHINQLFKWTFFTVD